MNRIKKIIILIPMVILMSVSMFPISSYAAIEPIIFNFSKPSVIDTTGYIAIKDDYSSDSGGYLIYYQLSPLSNSSLSYMGGSGVLVLDSVNENKIYYHIEGEPLTDYYFSYIILDTVGNIHGYYSFSFTGDFHNDYFYLPGYVYITHIDCQGNINRHDLELSYPTFEYLFAEDKYEYVYLLAILNVLQEYGSLSPEESKLLEDIVDSNDNITSVLSQIKTEFGTKLQQIIEDNEDFKAVLEQIYNSVDDIELTLSQFYDEVVAYLYLIDESLLYIWDNTDTLISNTDELEALLRQLLDEFTYTGTNVISQPDTSVLNGYYEAEGELLDNLQLSAPLNVDINSNALAFCWDTVELFFLSHDKVLAAVLVVLSFGIMAMVLGR